MKQFCLSVLALVCASLAWAIVEKTEKMTVVKTDGTTVEYNVADIEQVTFGIVEESYSMLVAPAGKNAQKIEAIPAVFRVTPDTDGNPYSFGLSMVEAATPADARQGDYAVELTVSSLKMNTADVDLAGGAGSGITVTLYSYKDGEVDNTWEAQTAGKLTTAVDNKTRKVTICLEAEYADGTKVVVDYNGAVIAADDLEGLNPPFVYVNQGQYFNADGVPGGIFDVTGMTYTPATTSRGVTGDKFEFTLSSGRSCWFILDTKYIGSTFDFATAGAGECYFVYDNIQLQSNGTSDFGLNGTTGTITVVKNEDNTFTIDFDVANKYTLSSGFAGGNPEHVILNYTSSESYVEPEPEPEPTPEPIENLENQSQFFDNDGNPEFPFTVVGITHKADAAIPYNSSVKGDRFDFQILDTDQKEVTCYIIIKPEYVGKPFDLATAEPQSYYFKYRDRELAASDLQFLTEKVGTEGTITITRNVDGTYNADLDFTFKTNGDPDSKAHLGLSYKSPTYDPEPDPEPALVNQGQYYNADGALMASFDVTGMTITENVEVLHMKGLNKFDLTLNNGNECFVALKPEYIGTEIDFANVSGDVFIIKYNSLTISSTGNSAMLNQGLEGKLSVIKNEDGSYTIDVNFLNNYKSTWGQTNDGSKEQVILNYTSPAPEPEPEPALVNQGQYYNADGNLMASFDVTGMTLTENVEVLHMKGLNKFDLTLNNGNECFVALKPEYIGTEIDFANVSGDVFIIKYNSLTISSTGNSAMLNQGFDGKLSVIKNEDGSYTIDVNFLNNYKSTWGQTNDGSKEQVILNYTSPAPEPEPVAEPNEGKYYNADGALMASFDVTGMKYTSNTSSRGVSGDKFEFTLSSGTTCWFILASKYIDSTFDFATAGAGECYFVYDDIQLQSNGTSSFGNNGTIGTITVIKNADDTFTIDFDVTNKYTTSWGTTGGNPEHVVLHFSGSAN